MDASHRDSQEKLLRTPRTMYPVIIVPLVGLLIIAVCMTVYFSPSKHATKAHANNLIALPGHVPGLIKQSQLISPADPNAPLTLMVGLRLRNQGSLEAYVNGMSQPHAAGQHLTPDQVAKAYGPLPGSQQAVIAFMQQAGFSVTATYKQHMIISFKGTVGEAENAFNVQINDYRAPSGRYFQAADGDPDVPSALAGIIQSISGLDTASQYGHPPITSAHQVTALTAATANAVTCLPASTTPSHNYYVPSQIAQAYNLNGLYNAGFHGEGQSIALFELDDYLPGDIAAYTSCYGGGAVPINRILVNGGTGHGPSNNAAEVELDMELALSAAPHLAQLDVYEAANSGAGVLQEWSQIISDAVPVVSTSWGVCEPQITQAFAQQENALFTIAAAQGQTIFAASGDHSADDCGTGNATTPSVDDPASQPFVTGVGGTSLTTDAAGSYQSEHLWTGTTNNGVPIGSGGGVSTFWTAPSWAKGPGVTNTGAFSSTSPCAANTGNSGQLCREVPDVALNADPISGYLIYYTASSLGRSSSNTWAVVGGTSAASPLWATMMALANEKSLHDGNFNIGFVNPYIYQIASGTNYGNDFHAVDHQGYYIYTGWGSYNALGLANDLEKLAASQTNARSAPASTTWYFAEGSVGNGFQEYITLLNPSTTQTATISVSYLFENKPAVTKQYSVAASTRYTISANAELGVALTDPQQAISTIVQSNVPIVAERPMYFNLHGIASGTDVVGATNASQTTFYFAEGDTRQDGTRTYYSYITMLNPSSSQTAHVTISYYSQGSVVGTQIVSVGPLQRGTATPAALGLHQQVAIKVASDSGIVVERPLYFRDNVPTAGGLTTGAASAVGVTSLGGAGGSDFLFAEGYTGTRNDFQEYLVLANFTATAAAVNVKLEYANGTTQTVPVTVAAQSQYYFDVNNAFSHPVAGCNCTPTPTVSAEVTATTASIVAERLMYFHFGAGQLSGGTDDVGEAGPASHAAYAFAEGYTYGSFSEFLTLQNPNNSQVTVAITLFADNTIVQQMKVLPAHSRTTISINSLIAPMAAAYPTNPLTRGYEVSMDIQCFGGTVVTERPMYFNWHGDIGGTDVLGYTGG